jgi:hypothetical protein
MSCGGLLECTTASYSPKRRWIKKINVWYCTHGESAEYSRPEINAENAVGVVRQYQCLPLFFEP